MGFSSDEEMLKAAAAEIFRAREETITFSLSVTDVLDLVGTIQLALRHPINVGGAAQRMREFAHLLEERLAHLGPGTAELCARGWRPEYDS